MGRRGIHNEAANLLRERLPNKVSIDENTAGRLFTLIYSLHMRDARRSLCSTNQTGNPATTNESRGPIDGTIGFAN
nr:UPF0262 family protein [Sinorhizobium fredii]